MGSYWFLGQLSAEEYEELRKELNAPWPDEVEEG